MLIISSPATSVNQMYANNAPGSGRFGRSKTKAYKKWLEKVGWELMAQRQNWPKLTTKYYGLTITFGRHLTKADIDNLVKGTTDLLVKLKITPDDRFKDESHIIRRTGVENVQLEIFDIHEDVQPQKVSGV